MEKDIFEKIEEKRAIDAANKKAQNEQLIADAEQTMQEVEQKFQQFEAGSISVEEIKEIIEKASVACGKVDDVVFADLSSLELDLKIARKGGNFEVAKDKYESAKKLVEQGSQDASVLEDYETYGKVLSDLKEKITRFQLLRQKATDFRSKTSRRLQELFSQACAVEENKENQMQAQIEK